MDGVSYNIPNDKIHLFCYFNGGILNHFQDLDTKLSFSRKKGPANRGTLKHVAKSNINLYGSKR